MNVTFFNDQIHTLVTHNPVIVERWVSDIENSHRRRLHRLIVGLDVEWRPNSIPKSIENPAATLQLCVGHRCLIFQLLHASHFPQLLKDFLGNRNYTFVGVKIDGDVKKLMKDHGLEVAKAVDLGRLAEEKGRMELRDSGLETLAREVLGKEVEKGKKPVRWSEWDNECLTPAQVQYACIDSFLSFEIGRRLKSGNSNKKYGFCRIIRWLVTGWLLMEVLRRVFQ